MYSSDSPLKSQLCFKHKKPLICGFKIHVANHVSAWRDQKFQLLFGDAVLSNPISPTKFERSLRKPSEPMLFASVSLMGITLKIIPGNLLTMDHLMLMHSFECFSA